MPLDVVCGGQAGDEGKGKITAYLAMKDDYDIAIRVGGPNAGHTIIYENKIYPLRSISCGFVNKKTRLLIPAGSYIILDWFLREIEMLNVEERIGIDYKTTIIEEKHIEEEKRNGNLKKIGSVGTGLGKAIRDKIERKEILFAKDVAELQKYLTNVSEEINSALKEGKKILVEGTQGFKLSLLHGEYPFVTSRDITASAFLSECGVASRRDVYLVFKPYTTRVGSGPLVNEIFDEKILEKYHKEGREIGTVSGRKRRIGDFEFETAEKAIKINCATKLCLTHIDIFGNKNYKAKKYYELTNNAIEFIQNFRKLERVWPYPLLCLISTGPELEDMIDLRY